MSADQEFYAYQMILGKPLREMPPWPTRRGRPREAAYVTTRAAWLARLETAIRELERGKSPKLATRARVATVLSLDPKTFRKYLHDLELDFYEIRERIRHEDP